MRHRGNERWDIIFLTNSQINNTMIHTTGALLALASVVHEWTSRHKRSKGFTGLSKRALLVGETPSARQELARPARKSVMLLLLPWILTHSQSKRLSGGDGLSLFCASEGGSLGC